MIPSPPRSHHTPEPLPGSKAAQSGVGSAVGEVVQRGLPASTVRLQVVEGL